MTLIRAQRGLLTKLAASLGITQAAVSMWTRVPAERLPDVERITGIPRHHLRPDICLRPYTSHIECASVNIPVNSAVEETLRAGHAPDTAALGVCQHTTTVNTKEAA